MKASPPIPPIPPTATPTPAIVETPSFLTSLPTPPPAPRVEEPLSNDLSDYQVLGASIENIEPPVLARPGDAALAVVRIRGCDASSNCVDTNLGSGAIIHPNGVILTAWHVTVLDPKNRALPNFYDHFLIEHTDDVSKSPQPRYYARWIAYNTHNDFALLRIVGEFGQSQEEWTQPLADLPWLPISNDAPPSEGELWVIGYSPTVSTVDYRPYRSNGLEEEGSKIRIPDALPKGFSGGPTVVENDDRYEIVGVVSSRVQENSYIRNVQQLKNLSWLPTKEIWTEQMWAENVEIVPTLIEGELQSRLEVTVHTLGYRATAFDPQADLLLISDAQEQKAQLRLQSGNFVNIQRLRIPIDSNSQFINQPLFVSIFRLNEGEVWRVEEWIRPEVLRPAKTATPIAFDTRIATATSLPATPVPPTFTPTPTATEEPAITVPAGDVFSCTAVSEISQQECEALVAIYESTNDPGWNKNEGWLETTMPCSWHGIKCQDGSVDQINLTQNGLSGELPPEIGNLVELKALELYANQISSIPPEIEKIVNLQWFYIAGNELQELPTEISNLPKLAVLSLNNNPLESLLPELGNLTNLRKLLLRSTSLSRLPSTISNLINLETLDLSENLLNDLPIELTNLTRLTELDVGQNALVDLSPTLQTFLDEKDPDWANNQIVDVSPDITPPPGIGSTYVNPVDGATYLYVPAGEFIMGSSDEQVDYAHELCNTYRSDCERTWFGDEQPQRTVYLDSYWIMQTEVANAQYGKFMDAGGYTIEEYWSSEGWVWRIENHTEQPRCWDNSNFNSLQQPVVCVSWYEAEAYANWLSAETGLDLSLPTEAQWEKAAQGPDGRMYPWGNQWDGNKANFGGDDDGYKWTAPVGHYPAGANAYGVLDMAGNVWEWIADWYVGSYYQNAPNRNPPGPASGTNRVLRSGAWNYDPYDLRTVNRDWHHPIERHDMVGFRLVRHETAREN